MAAMKMLVNIDVPQLGPAIDFYSRALPLTLRRILDDDVAELSGASADIYLLQKAAGSRPAKDPDDVRQYRRHWTPVHLDLHVDNLKTALAQALQAGAKQEQLFENPKHPSVAFCADPFGHGFCLIERRQKK